MEIFGLLKVLKNSFGDLSAERSTPPNKQTETTPIKSAQNSSPLHSSAPANNADLSLTEETPPSAAYEYFLLKHETFSRKIGKKNKH